MSPILTEYVSHLASDGDRRFTACGEPWQEWQIDDATADAANAAGHPIQPPGIPPRPHKDVVRQCQACLRAGTGSALDRKAGGVAEDLRDAADTAVDEWPYDDDPPDPL